ncbi:MAG: hydroxyacid dehydrogenase [Marinosulfonomonas sp.]
MAHIAFLMGQEPFEGVFPPKQLARLGTIPGVSGWMHLEDLNTLKSHENTREIGVLVTGWGTPKLDMDLFGACPDLALIAHFGGTIRSFISAELLNHLRLSTSSSPNAIPVAEFVLSWVLRWNKRLPQWEAAYKAPGGCTEDRQNATFTASGNYGKIIGVIGASKVGKHLISLLQHFDLEVLLSDPTVSMDQAAALGARKVELSQLMSVSDVVSINAPLLPGTRHLINRAALAQMQDGALLINTARGGLVDHDALLAELSSGRLHAVLDVTDPEPLPAESPFFALPNAYLTPHVAGSLGDELHRLADNVIDEIECFMSTGRLNHEVTQENWDQIA